MNEKSLKLLEQYETEIVSTRRGRGSYICETSHGKKLLANCASSEKKMVFVNRMLKMLKEKGYAYADIAMENREGNLLTADRDEGMCILKDWYEGRECDTKSLPDIEMAVKKIAQLHKWMYMEPQEESKDARYTGEDLRMVLERHNRELRKTYAYIRKRRQKSNFEIQFLNCFPVFYEQAQEAQKRLEASEYGILRARMHKEGSLCHGSFNQHNIWFLTRNQVFIGNFDKCCYDVQLHDVYQFMRKIMEKQEWSAQAGYRIIETYDKEKTITEQEKEYLYVKLLYPEKFWKLANQYYNHNKAWIPEKNAQKLQRLVQQQNSRNSFLKTLE